MNVVFHTLGCKVNTCDTEIMIRQFREAGYTIADDGEPADICIVNTCTVTATADFKSRQALRKARRRYPDALVVAAGCFAQVSAAKLAAIPAVDLVIGNREKDRIASLVTDCLVRRSKSAVITPVMEKPVFVSHFLSPERERVFGDADTETGRTRAFLKIQDGCGHHCSYCLIPRARGPARSRDILACTAQACRFAKAGYREIVLTGINLSAYGRDLGADTDLAGLVAAIAATEGVDRVRLGSLEPFGLSRDLVLKLAVVSELCPHFHLSLQSGCAQTLHRMRRPYTPEQYMDMVMLLRQYYPDAAIWTDVMTGFPGETDDDFETSVDFIRQVGFAGMHIFRYSARPGTPAAAMPGQVTESQKERRSAILLKIGQEAAAGYLKRWVGRQVPVLFEDDRRGLTPHHVPVVLSQAGSRQTEAQRTGKILPVQVRAATKIHLLGELAEWVEKTDEIV